MISRVRRRWEWVLVTLAGALVAGCPQVTPTQTSTDEKPVLRAFTSSDELLGFFKQQAQARYGSSVFGYRGLGGLLATPTATADVAAEGGANESQASDTTSYSTTNLQEAGVDESDVFKSDGEYFYIGNGSTLRIVRATPADQLAQVGQIQLDATADELYLYGSTAIVLGQRYAENQASPDGAEIYMWPPYYVGTSVVVYAVDISDPTNPAVAGEIELEGSLVSSRLTGGRLFLVLTIVPDLPENPTLLSIGMMTLDEVLPQAAVDGATEDMVAWQDYYRPSSGDGFYTTAVVTLDAGNIEQIVGSVAVMADAGTVYASQDALYITDDEWDAQNNWRQTTVVHKLAFDDEAGARYVGSGSVPGRLLNQFSLGEYDGYLRVATFVDNWGVLVGTDVIAVDNIVSTQDAPVTSTATAGTESSEGLSESSEGVSEGSEGDEDAGDGTDAVEPVSTNSPYNAVFVLGESQDELQIVGRIEDIAPGEQLYAARFMSARGYLVTYEQIDPLFVLDLSDPTSPTILGELKIPGYSDYLHPFGDDLLIGVGRSVAQTQWGFSEPDAVQLSLFDVSDPANPQAVQQIELGGAYSSSEVSSTHKAFTFLPDSGRLAIPVHLTPDGTNWDDNVEFTFDGVVCYQVSSTGFEELGRVACVVDDSDNWVYGWRGWGWNDWRRAAFIGDTLYAVTQDGVRAAPLSDFSATVTVELISATDQ